MQILKGVTPLWYKKRTIKTNHRQHCNIHKGTLDSDKYKSNFQTMIRFHKYSPNNTIIISMQKPYITLTAGFNKCRDGFSNYVKNG